MYKYFVQQLIHMDFHNPLCYYNIKLASLVLVFFCSDTRKKISERPLWGKTVVAAKKIWACVLVFSHLVSYSHFFAHLRV